MIVLTNFFNTFFSYTFKSYGLLYGISDHTLSTAASFGGISVCVSKMMFGWLMDIYGYKKLYCVLLGLHVINILAGYFMVEITFIYFLVILSNYFVWNGVFICVLTSCGNVFGPHYGVTVYSFCCFGSLTSSFLNIINSKFILINFGFHVCYSISMVFTVGSMFILWRFEEKLDGKYAVHLKVDELNAVPEDNEKSKKHNVKNWRLILKVT